MGASHTVSLEPLAAAELAVVVYDLQKSSFSPDRVNAFAHDWHFNLNAPHSRILGTSGTAFVLHKATGFCTIAEGVGKFKGHVLVLTRGTDSPFDWGTDATAGYVRTHSGYTAHTGFYGTFQSILRHGLQAYFEGQRQRILKVHCVGHSLGGALATLIAEWVALQKKADEVALYTFGSPRVGFNDYSLHVEGLLGKHNIYRVFHQQDPVPWVPVWPFVHVPVESFYRLGGSGARYINPSSHSMDDSYQRTIAVLSGARAITWEDLQDKSWTQPTKAALKRWLESDDPMSFCANTLSLLGAAIAWVFEVACEALTIAFQFLASGAITLLDLMVQILTGAIKTGSEEVSGLVKNLINKVNQFNGRPPLKDSEITQSTTAIVFRDMQDKLNHEVKSALAASVNSEAA